MTYDFFPAVDGNNDFAPAIRAALAKTTELRSLIIPMTTVARNNLTAGEKWDGRVIANTTTDRLERYDAGTTTWVTIPDFADVTTAANAAQSAAAADATAKVAAHAGSYAAYDPAYNGAGPIFLNATKVGRWIRIANKTIAGWFSGTYYPNSQNAWYISLPTVVAATHNVGPALGVAWATDVSTSQRYMGVMVAAGGGLANIWGGSTNPWSDAGGSTHPFAWVAGDQISGTFCYEEA